MRQRCLPLLRLGSVSLGLDDQLAIEELIVDWQHDRKCVDGYIYPTERVGAQQLSAFVAVELLRDRCLGR
jgi:hypothetical protein